MMEKRPQFHKRKPLEKTQERNANKHCKRLGIAQYKFTSPGHSGVPDRLYIARPNRFLFIEWKRPGKEPTPLQYHEISVLLKLGVSATWTDSAVEGRRLLEALAAGII
jgi:hypothetical protein